MNKLVATAVSALLVVAASFEAAAHSMQPGYEKKFAPGEAFSIYYEVKNDYEYPATFRIEVFAKDGKTVEEGWKLSDSDPFKLFPGNKKRIRVKLRMLPEIKQRKILVCSILDKVGYNDKEPGTISRVCSRLWLWR